VKLRRELRRNLHGSTPAWQILLKQRSEMFRPCA
jgi:hypothetical protein